MLINHKNVLVISGFLLLLSFACAIPGKAVAQQTLVKGRVTAATTGEPIPFVNVYFTGSEVGTTTDFDGFYSVSTVQAYDSITVSSIGYISLTKSVKARVHQTENFELEESAYQLQEVVVRSGKVENPAFAIIRQVILNKEKNDKRGLSAYEYESYNKVEVGLSDASGKLNKKLFFRQVDAILDSLPPLENEQGVPVIPIFLSENISELFYRNNPEAKKEKILKTQVKGIGVEGGGMVSQLLGTSLQDYNFYEDWLNFLDKRLVSPIGVSWKLYYNYELVDSLFISDEFCYQIKVSPKREQDLAFTGLIWITKKEYALKQLDVSIRESANLNFFDEIKIQQQLLKTSSGNWLPEKSRATVVLRPFRFDMKEVIFVVRFYNSIKDPVVNKPRDLSFYRYPLEVAPNAEEYGEGFWQENRHDSLTAEEVRVIQMIDKVNSSAVMRRSLGIIKSLGSGYIDLGKIDIGPLPLFYLHNQVEGSRVGFGLRTNKDFSHKFRLALLGGYGLGDKELKYNLSSTYFFSKLRWSYINFTSEREIEQVGLDPQTIRDNFFFYASSKWGRLDSPYFYRNNSLRFQTDLWKGGTSTISLRSVNFDPLYSFEYIKEPFHSGSPSLHSFATTELAFELRLSYKENFVTTNFRRVSLDNSKWPVLSMRSVFGLKDVFGADFSYQKFSLDIFQRINLAFLGITSYRLEGGRIFNPLPYPLLQVHTGNESFFYTNAAFNLMDYMEFVSDSYCSLRLLHNFEGNIMNKIPLIRKLNLRLLAEANVLYGSLSAANQHLLLYSGNENTLASNLSPLTSKPYIELGYGIENIFRFIRVDAFHRLTYLDKPDVRKFGVKISAQISL